MKPNKNNFQFLVAPDKKHFNPTILTINVQNVHHHLLCTFIIKHAFSSESSVCITLFKKFDLALSICKIPAYLVNHQAANTELFAHGTDIIVASCYADV
jgi:hypothetical protein